MSKQAFRIIPKSKPKTPWWIHSLVVLSFLSVLTAVIFYVLFNQQVVVLDNTKKDLESQISNIRAQGTQELEKELSAMANNLREFADIFEQHQKSSKVFDLIRTVCHQQIQFSSLNLNSQERTVSMEGSAENLKTLGEQMVILTLNEEIDEPQLTEISLAEEGKVTFNLSFSISETFFKE